MTGGLLKDVGEWGLLEIVRKTFAGAGRGVVLGIGDDAAVLRQGKKKNLLAATDVLVEGIHFDLSYTPPFHLGRKAVAVNLSDIAAMGGTPRHALLSLALPGRLSRDFYTRFLHGVKSISSEYGVSLVGGDTSSSRGGIFVSLTVLGEAGPVVTRAGAEDGDRICVTGTLGDSALGLNILKKTRGLSLAALTRTERYCALRHLDPRPRLAEGRALCAGRLASAMIDVSDGLMSDLEHIAQESRIGARLWAEKIPLSREFSRLAPSCGLDPLAVAASGGEDYELLFTVRRRQSGRNLSRILRTQVTEIGVMDASLRGIVATVHGRPYAIAHKGYEHFG